MLFSFVPSLIAPGDPSFEIHQKMIVGNELRLIIVTKRTFRPFLSHSSKVADVKGYFVTIDLTSSKQLKDRARVYDPLWEVAQPRSLISFDTGANFTQDDVDANAATPDFSIDVDGTLLRFKRDTKQDVVTCDALFESPNASSWKQQADLRKMNNKQPFGSENKVYTPSGRFGLFYNERETKLFNIFTGE